MTTSSAPHLLIVEARFYNELSDALLDGAKRGELLASGLAALLGLALGAWLKRRGAGA